MNSHGYPQHMSNHQVRTDQAREREGFVDRTWAEVAAHYKEQERMETQRIAKMPSDEYHADPAISNSSLKVFAESRRKYHARFVAKTLPPERTKSMDLGTVAHAAILEPHIIKDVCRVIPDEVLASGAKRGKQWEEFEAANSDKILLKPSELGIVRGMFESVYAHPIAKDALQAEGPCEEVIKWTCEETGLARRVRQDKRVANWGIADIKTANSVYKPFFAKSCATYRYAHQQAYYSDGYRAAFGEVPKFIFIAVETEAPFLVRVYELDPQQVQIADDTNKRMLHDLAACMNSNEWADENENEIQLLTLPRWSQEQFT